MLLRILILPAAVVATAVLALGYLGFVPGVASLFGSDKPRDLGIKATAADLQSANSNDKITKIPGLSVKSATMSNGSVKFDGTLPATEATVHQ